jgi:hypothetical protein
MGTEQAIVELTDSGRAALDAAAPGHPELVRSVVFDGLRAAQLRAFGSTIESVLERLTSPLRWPSYQSDSVNLMTPRMFLPSSMSAYPSLMFSNE